MQIKTAIRSILRHISPTYRAVTSFEKKLNASREKERNEQRYLWWLAQMRPGETMAQTKQRVFLDMPPAEGDLRLVQRLGSYLLYRFKELCEDNGLRYYLAAGTLLGAVRHKGFIPWDDDTDVFMPREDFNKLCALLAQNDEFYIQTGDRGNGTIFYRFCTRKATAVIRLDIFIMDFADVQATDRDKMRERIITTRQQMLAAQKKARHRGAGPAALAAIRKKYISRLPQDTQGKYVYMSIDALPFEWMVMYPAEDIFPLGRAEFEGETYCVPGNPEKMLAANYGSYIDFPPLIQPMHDMTITPEDAAVFEQFLKNAYQSGKE